MAKRTTSKEATPPPLPFEDRHLSLCVLDALVELDLVSTSIMIPELAPDDDDDLDDESESWRDKVENNQTEPIEQLLALLARNLDKLPRVEEIHGSMINIAEMYEADFYTLAGIEQCSGLRSIAIWTTSKKLDLTPLMKLPRLATVNLTCGSAIGDLSPLLEIPSLRRVIVSPGQLHPRMVAALNERNIEVGPRA